MSPLLPPLCFPSKSTPRFSSIGSPFMKAVPVNQDWIEALFPNGTTPTGTKQAPGSSINLEMLGARASSGGGFTVAYDSNLILKDGNQNHTLTLVLKIHLN